jgi:hypothetical protein
MKLCWYYGIDGQRQGSTREKKPVTIDDIIIIIIMMMIHGAESFLRR